MKLSLFALSFAAAALSVPTRAQWHGFVPQQPKAAPTAAQKQVTSKVRAPAQAAAQLAPQSSTAQLALPPTNDECTGATVISGFGTFPVSTVTATGTGVNGTCQPVENDVWFAWTAPANGAIEVSTCNLVGSDTVIAAWSDCPATTLVACNDDACTLRSRMQFAVTAGTTYFLEFGEFNSGVTYTGSFSITALGTPPPNDDCTGATPISGFGSFLVDTNNALGTVPTFTCANANNDVWFAWTSPVTGAVQVSTCNLIDDTVIAVWADCPATTLVDCNDDSCGLQSLVQFTATSGVTYFFELGAFQTSTSFTGTFDVNPGPPPPPNDDCSTPIAIVGSGPHAFDNTLATMGAQGQLESLCNSLGSTAIDHDVWFCWTAPSTNAFEISTVGATFVDTKVAVYGGCGCPVGAALACNDDSCSSPQSTLSFNAVGGQTYTIQVGTNQGFPGSTGSFTVLQANGPVGGCVLDDGTAENAIGLAAGGKMAWMSRFGQIGVTTVISDVSSAYGAAVLPPLPPNGTPTDILVWDDPNDDGNPFDCVLVYQGVSSVQNVGTGAFNPHAVVPALSVDGYFFVGVGCPHGPNEFPAPLDQTSPNCASPEPTWLVGDTSGNLDYANLLNNNVPPMTASSAGFPGFWLLRGSCTPGPGVSYCAGDGLDPVVTTSCPCSNFGAQGNGCRSSFNPAGAHITAHGAVASDNVVLDGSGMNPTGPCIFLKGSADAPAGIVFGDGLRCADGTLIRLRAVALSAGTASFPNSTETVTLSTRGGTPVGSGLTGYYTIYYRNAAAAFCPPDTFNAANGYRITW
jgi:hypothetical protein